MNNSVFIAIKSIGCLNLDNTDILKITIKLKKVLLSKQNIFIN